MKFHVCGLVNWQIVRDHIEIDLIALNIWNRAHFNYLTKSCISIIRCEHTLFITFYTHTHKKGMEKIFLRRVFVNQRDNISSDF